MANLSNFFQRGQVLPLTLVLLPMVLAVVFYMYNSGQLVQEKIALTNTADAVAYSAGVYEARVLNYDAYINRAMVANEIAIAQAVGLASWTRYASQASTTVGPYVGLIPGANAATLMPALQQVRLNQPAIIQMLNNAVTAHNQAINTLKAAQNAVHGGNGSPTVIANRQAVVNRIAALNDPAVTVHLDIPNAGANDIAFENFTQYYGLDKRQRMIEAVLNSQKQEEFLSNPDLAQNVQGRNWSSEPPADCDTGVAESLDKVGATEIIGDEIGGNTIGYNRWTSVDTLTRYYLEYVDIYDADGNIIGQDCYVTNQVIATGSANSLSTTFPIVERGAIPEFYDLSTAALTSFRPSTQLVVRVTKPMAQQNFSGGTSVVKPSGQLDLYDGNHAQEAGVPESTAIAKVEVFFDRPDGVTYPNSSVPHRGSLFNPYWQAHLVSSDLERASAWLLQGF